MSDHYRAPGWFTRNVFNQLVAFLTRQGISVLVFAAAASQVLDPHPLNNFSIQAITIKH